MYKVYNRERALHQQRKSMYNNREAGGYLQKEQLEVVGIDQLQDLATFAQVLVKLVSIRRLRGLFGL